MLSTEVGSVDFFCCQGGTRGPSLLSATSVGESSREILVEPPEAFSPLYEVKTTDEGSIISRSETFPKESRLESKAPLKRLEPMALPKARPCSASYVKSASKGPNERDWPAPDTVNDHVPFSRGNSNEKFRVRPGPSEEIPASDSTFFPSLVTT